MLYICVQLKTAHDCEITSLHPRFQVFTIIFYSLCTLVCSTESFRLFPTANLSVIHSGHGLDAGDERCANKCFILLHPHKWTLQGCILFQYLITVDTLLADSFRLESLLTALYSPEAYQYIPIKYIFCSLHFFGCKLLRQRQQNDQSTTHKKQKY